MKPRRIKYGNRKCLYKGMAFDSVLERDRYVFLESEQARGSITDLERQVRYPLEVNGSLVCAVVPDFRYRVGGRLVVEDAKSEATVTPAWRVKQKLFEAIHGVPIHIVTRESLTSLPSA